MSCTAEDAVTIVFIIIQYYISCQRSFSIQYVRNVGLQYMFDKPTYFIVGEFGVRLEFQFSLCYTIQRCKAR